MQETWVRSLGWEDPLEKEMAAHSSILAWKISWTEEPGGLQLRCHKESVTTERLALGVYGQCYSQLAHTLLPAGCPHTSVLCVCVSMAALQIQAHQDHPLRNDIACGQQSVYNTVPGVTLCPKCAQLCGERYTREGLKLWRFHTKLVAGERERASTALDRSNRLTSLDHPWEGASSYSAQEP